MHDRIAAELEIAGGLKDKVGEWVRFLAWDQTRSLCSDAQVKRLNLDHVRTTGTITGLSAEFTSLKVLSAINSQLTSLKGFPVLPSLVKVRLLQ
jgi:hypothetical protein